MFLYILMYW